jgi:hypothetical protein
MHPTRSTGYYEYSIPYFQRFVKTQNACYPEIRVTRIKLEPNSAPGGLLPAISIVAWYA